MISLLSKKADKMSSGVSSQGSHRTSKSTFPSCLEYNLHSLFSLLYFLKNFLAVLPRKWDLNSWGPGSNLHPLQWKCSLTHWTAKKSPFSSILKEVPCVLIILGHDPLFSAHVASTFHYEINLSKSFVERKGKFKL